VIFRDLKEVEEAPGLGEFTILVENSGVSLGQVVGVVLPGDLGRLQSKMG